MGGRGFEQVELVTENSLATVRLNRPDRYNALGARIVEDLASETTIEQGLRYETAAIRATLASEDYAIGLAAFAEKRTPRFPPLTARRIT